MDIQCGGSKSSKEMEKKNTERKGGGKLVDFLLIPTAHIQFSKAYFLSFIVVVVVIVVVDVVVDVVVEIQRIDLKGKKIKAERKCNL